MAEARHKDSYFGRSSVLYRDRDEKDSLRPPVFHWRHTLCCLAAPKKGGLPLLPRRHAARRAQRLRPARVTRAPRTVRAAPRLLAATLPRHLAAGIPGREARGAAAPALQRRPDVRRRVPELPDRGRAVLGRALHACH